MKSQSWRQHLMKKFTPRQNKLAQTQQIRPFRQRARTHLTKFDANNNNSLHLYRRNESILKFILLWLALKFHWRTWVLKHDANTSEIPTSIIDLHFLVKGRFFRKMFSLHLFIHCRYLLLAGLCNGTVVLVSIYCYIGVHLRFIKTLCI